MRAVSSVVICLGLSDSSQITEDKLMNGPLKGFALRTNLTMALFGATTIALLPSPVIGQDASDKLLEEVVVSASRVDARPGYEAPTPTTVIDSTMVEDAAQPNIADLLNRLPSMGQPTSPRTSGNDVGAGAQGANFVNLRGLGSNRTLVLLDGRRVVASATTGQVDLNMLPSTLLKRTEVVSGGASAAWGSDAVAGVVNLVLDRKFTGVKASVQTGTSAESDADEFKVDLAGGFEFAEGRGHVIGSLNYTDSESVDRADSRSWFKSTKLVRNPNAGNPGEPDRLVLDGVGNFIGSDAGHTFLSAGPLAGRTFAPDGSLQAFDFGTRFPMGPLGTSTTGDGSLNDFSGRTQLLAGYEQVNTFIRGSYDITDKVNVYGEFMYSDTTGESLSVPYYRFAGALRINRDNPFLPADLATQMDAFGMDSIPLGRSNIDFGRANPYNERSVERYVLGVDVEFNDNWSMEAYYQRGNSEIINEVRSNASRANYALATDAVDDGAGNIVCRSTLTDPTNGCVAANIFGLGAPSAAAVDYVVGTARQKIELTQDVVAVSVNGDLFDLPAGPVSSAFGIEYRKEDFSGVADDISQNSGWWVGNYKNAGGDYDVTEAFAEVVVPIFNESAMGESLDLNAAVRVTDYSTSGAVTTWKAGLTYNIGAGVSLRGTASSDIRAPNLNEYFSGGQTNSIFLDDPFVAGNPNYLVTRTIQGNTSLDPEEADTTTIGIVYQPEFIPGLTLSVDYFDIEVDGSIGTVVDQDVVDRCFAGEASFCGLITRDATTGLMTNLFNSPVNLTIEALTAYDFEASYSFQFAGGNVDISTLWTYTTDHYVEDRGVRDELLGEFGGTTGGLDAGPQEWRALSSARYSNDRLTLSLRHRFIGEGVIDAQWVSGVDVDDNKVDSVNYFDFTAAYKLTLGNMDVEVFGNIDNLFDEDPPRVAFDGGTALDDIGAANSFHDLIGRYFRVGLRTAF
ncbi:MAG: TonB-dependent receptor [Pseudomonadales bacterium]